MKRLSGAVALAGLICAVPSVAVAQNGQVQGFGGLTFGDVTGSSTFGASPRLSENMQVIVEGGRMTDVVPSLVGTIVDFTPIDFGVSAWYGEAGIRVLAPARSAVRPYAEATAGFARLRTNFHGTPADSIVNTALGFFDRTEPLLGVGGGVILQGGPMFVDLGYRYKKILADDSLQSFITGGDFHVNQVRFGLDSGFEKDRPRASTRISGVLTGRECRGSLLVHGTRISRTSRDADPRGSLFGLDPRPVNNRDPRNPRPVNKKRSARSASRDQEEIREIRVP